MVKSDPEAELEKLSEEHGPLNVAARRKYRVGSG